MVITIALVTESPPPMRRKVDPKNTALSGKICGNQHTRSVQYAESVMPNMLRIRIGLLPILVVSASFAKGIERRRPGSRHQRVAVTRMIKKGLRPTWDGIETSGHSLNKSHFFLHFVHLALIFGNLIRVTIEFIWPVFMVIFAANDVFKNARRRCRTQECSKGQYKREEKAEKEEKERTRLSLACLRWRRVFIRCLIREQVLGTPGFCAGLTLTSRSHHRRRLRTYGSVALRASPRTSRVYGTRKCLGFKFRCLESAELLVVRLCD
jgi:hypothetical protein